MSVQVRPGEQLPLELLLFDGDTTRHPVAHVFNENGAPLVGSPFVLTGIGLGRYINQSHLITTAEKRFTAVYIIYEDMSHTNEDLFYERAEDVFDVSDLSALLAAQSNYVNRMSTAYNSTSGIQEVLVWPEKNGQIIAGTNCDIAVKTSSGVVVWQASLAAPTPDGLFPFIRPVVVQVDANYYIEIDIVVDGFVRHSRQAFVSIG